jgi:hypothetical protein
MHLRRSKSERSAVTSAWGSVFGRCGFPRKRAQKLVELGYLSLDSKGDKRAQAIAIEAYLGDSLS